MGQRVRWDHIVEGARTTDERIGAVFLGNLIWAPVSPARYNPLRGFLMLVGLGLARLGLIERRRVARTTDLAWPRIVTGIARMSKATVDVAMVGLAVGPIAIAGLGFATPFWTLAFALGGGIAGATISQVSQRFGADTADGVTAAVVTSAMLVLLVTVPIAVVCWLVPDLLIGLVGSDAAAIAQGATYLQIVGLGIPFAGLNLVASRALVGADDAWTPMVLRGGGAVVNVVLNAILIFGLQLGVAGAAMGTLVSNVVILVVFAAGFLRGGLPMIGSFPVRVRLNEPFVERAMLRDLVEVGAPLTATGVLRFGGMFPKIALVGLLGPNVTAAYVVATRIRALMDAPNWGFSLASSSLVGQALGAEDEAAATAWATAVLRHSVAIYVIVAATVFALAGQIARLFVAEPAVIALVVPILGAACVSVVFSGVEGGALGPLRASGDTRWPLYGQLVGMYLVALPVLGVGVVANVGLSAVMAAIILEKAVPAAITYWRYRSGAWRAISRQYRPEPTASMD